MLAKIFKTLVYLLIWSKITKKNGNIVSYFANHEPNVRFLKNIPFLEINKSEEFK